MDSVSGIDNVTLNKAEKGLSISFIICIFLANSLLIFMTVRKPGFLYRPKDLLIISLAIGDIFLALFPLIIFAKITFGDMLDIICTTAVTAHVYMSFLIHFVYGAGLLTLAVELLLRYKRQSGVEKTNFVTSLAYSAVPWILGLVVVLPLTMAGMDWESCVFTTRSKSRLLAMFGVSVILPAVLSVIVCIVVCCIRLIPVQQTHLAYTYPSTAPGVFSGYQQDPTNKADPPAETQLILPTYNQYPTQNVQHQYMYPPSQQSPTSYPAVGYVAQSDMVISAPVHPIQPQNSAATSFTDPNREKVILLVSAIVFSLCVVPYAVYTMGTIDPYYSRGSIDTILDTTLMWLMIFRSLVIPLIWIVSSRRKERPMRHEIQH